MKKVLLGIINGLLLGLALFLVCGGTIAGPSTKHRQDGVIEIKDDGSSFNAVDPTTQEVVSKTLRPMRMKVFLDVPESGHQYVTWQSNRLFNHDIQYHLKKSKEHTSVRAQETLDSFWSFWLGPWMSGIITCIFFIIGSVFLWIILH